MLLASFVKIFSNFCEDVQSGANSQIEAIQHGIALRIISPFYLSGFIFSIEGMPKFFQYITWIVPERHLIEVMRGVILRGAGIEHLWLHALYLTVLSIFMLFVAVSVYRKKIE